MRLSGLEGKMWIRPYQYHILHHLPKFKTDFLEKQFARLKKCSETEQNDRYILVFKQF